MGLLFFRAFLSHQLTFFFLVWNLFLAFIPWMLSIWAKRVYRKGKRRYFLFPIIASWLLFFPNAPYILTDLFHLHQRTDIPLWYDLLLILSFAWTGLWMGLISLRYMHEIVAEWFGKKTGWVFALSGIFAAAFGIYVGRFLRWNSWDILFNPFSLMNELGHRFLHPMEHPRTWGVTIMLSVLLGLIYLSFHLFAPQEKVRS